MNDLANFVLILVGCIITYLLGYRHGAKTARTILRIHLQEGRDFEVALDYEDSVAKGKCPKRV